MKSISLIRSFSRGFLVPSFMGFTLLFSTVEISCCKNNVDKTNNKNETPLPSGDVDATTTGATPNDSIDDTQAIQDAIDSSAARGGGTVWLPSGDYNVNADKHLNLKSYVTLSMDSARLITSPSSNERYYVIQASGIANAAVLGGQIIGERDSHLGTGGEHGMGIGILGSDSITIKGSRISKCWGDGVYVSSIGGTPSTNITIQKVLCNDNRRQGISLIEVNGVLIDSCTFTNTNGTAPKDGIDIEPNSGTAQNVTIQYCEIANNIGNGVEMNAKAGTGAVIKDIAVQYNNIHNNAYGGYVQNSSNVNFTHNTMVGNKYNPAVYSKNCSNCVLGPNP